MIRAATVRERPDPWSADIKVTDEFLAPVFKSFYRKLDLPLGLRKSDYHVLAGLMPKEVLQTFSWVALRIERACKEQAYA